MVKFLGLTTVSALEKAQRECDQWKKDFYENNEIIERFQQMLNAVEEENMAIKAKLEDREAKIESLAQELSDCKIWVKTLEDTNREQADKIGKQVNAITKALEESARSAMLYNQATVEHHQYKIAVKIATENFTLQTL